MRINTFILICLLIFIRPSYSINLPEGDQLITLTEAKGELFINILSSGGRTRKLPWSLEQHHQINLKNKYFICFLNTPDIGASKQQSVGIVYSNKHNKHFLQPIHIPKVKQAQNLIFGKSIPLNVRLESANERFISASFYKQHKTSIYKTKFINNSDLVLQEINLNRDKNKQQWQFISTEIIKFSLHSHRSLISIHSGDFYNQKKDHLCVISKDHQFLYFNWLILTNKNNKLKLHKNIEKRRPLIKNNSMFSVGDFYNCGRDLILESSHIGQYSLQFAPSNPELLPNPMEEILGISDKPNTNIESGQLLKYPNQKIVYVQTLNKPIQKKHLNRKFDLELKNDIGIAFIRRLKNNKVITAWPNKGDEIQFEINIRNNGSQPIERNLVHLDIWAKAEFEDSNINLLNTSQAAETITIKRKIEVFNNDNYTKIIVKKKWPTSKVNSEGKYKWFIVQARYKDDRNLSNNRLAINWMSQQLPMTYNSNFSRNLMYYNDSPISSDYYLNKLALAYSNIWKRGGLNQNFHYVRFYENKIKKKPFIFDNCKPESLLWQNFTWSDAIGDLKKLWLHFSPIKPFGNKMVFPSSFTQKHIQNLFLVNHELSLPLNSITLPSRIANKVQRLNNIKPSPVQQLPFNNYLSEKIIFTLSNELNQPITNAKLRLLPYENGNPILSGNTNKYGVWHTDLKKYNIDHKWNNLAHYTDASFDSRTLIVEAKYKGNTEYIPIQKGPYHGPLAIHYASLISNPAIIELKSHTLTPISPLNINYRTSIKDKLLSIEIDGKISTKIELLEKLPNKEQWTSLRKYTCEKQSLIIPIDLNKDSLHDFQLRQFSIRSIVNNKKGPLLTINALPFKSATAISNYKNGLIIPTAIGQNNSCIQHYQKTNFKNFIFNINNEKVKIRKVIPSKKHAHKYYCLLKYPYKNRLLVSIHTGEKGKLFTKPKLLFPEKSDDLAEANDIVLIHDEDNEYIIVADTYKKVIVLFDQSTNKISQWTRPGFTPTALCTNPNKTNGFLVLDRRENNNSWLYKFSITENKLNKEYVWLNTIPVSSQQLKSEIGLSCIINPSIPENIHIAISCIKNKNILEYLWVKDEEKLLLLKNIDRYNSKPIIPTDLTYQLDGNKIHLYFIDDEKSLNQLY